MKIISVIACACAIFSNNAFALGDGTAFTVDTALLERNMADCEGDGKYPSHRPENPEAIYWLHLADNFMKERDTGSHDSRACIIGRLDNAILLYESCLESGVGRGDTGLKLAAAKLKRATFLPEGKKDSLFRDAEALFQPYLDNSMRDPHNPLELHVMVSSLYKLVAEITNDGDSAILFDKAIAIARNGRETAIASLKGESDSGFLSSLEFLTEGLGSILNSRAKHYKGKDEGKFRDAMRDLIRHQMGFISENGSPLAFNERAANEILAENTRKWLWSIRKEEADPWFCNSLFEEPGLTWFRRYEKRVRENFIKETCPSSPPPPNSAS